MNTNENILRLALSEHKISDSDISELSDILTSYDLWESAKNGLIDILVIMKEYNYEFPISMNFLRDLWKKNNIDYNFTTMIINLVQIGGIKLRKIKKDDLDYDIIRSSRDTGDEIVVIESTEKIDDVYSFLNLVLGDKIEESYHYLDKDIPKKVEKALKDTANKVDGFGVDVHEESYNIDENNETEEIGISLHSKGEFDKTEKELKAIAKSDIKTGNKEVVNVEVIKDGKKEIFLNIVVKGNSKLGFLSNSLYKFVVDALEIEVE